MDAKRKKELKKMLVVMKDGKIIEIRKNNEDIASTDNFKDDAQDFADTATNIYEKELQYDLTEKNKQVLIDIEDALERISSGSYGSCNSCGANIPIERLKALPFAKTCVKCLSIRPKLRRAMLPIEHEPVAKKKKVPKAKVAPKKKAVPKKKKAVAKKKAVKKKKAVVKKKSAPKKKKTTKKKTAKKK